MSGHPRDDAPGSWAEIYPRIEALMRQRDEALAREEAERERRERAEVALDLAHQRFMAIKARIPHEALKDFDIATIYEEADGGARETLAVLFAREPGK